MGGIFDSPLHYGIDPEFFLGAAFFAGFGFLPYILVYVTVRHGRTPWGSALVAVLFTLISLVAYQVLIYPLLGQADISGAILLFLLTTQLMTAGAWGVFYALCYTKI